MKTFKQYINENKDALILVGIIVDLFPKIKQLNRDTLSTTDNKSIKDLVKYLKDNNFKSKNTPDGTIYDNGKVAMGITWGDGETKATLVVW